MVSAYLYRVRRALLKQPWKFLIALLGFAFFCFMMAFPTIMGMPNSDGTVSDSFVPRDVNVVTGGMYLIEIAMFSFMFYTGLKNGVVGFSTADVNFHMAGPFTPRFNLIIAASGTLQLCFVFTFVLGMQSALIYQATGVATADLVTIIILSFVASVIGYFLGSLFGARTSDNEAKRRFVLIIGIIINAVSVLGFVFTLFSKYPSVEALKDLGIKGIIAFFGQSVFAKAFPGGGWVSLIYDGVINASPVRLFMGIILTVALIGVIVVLYGHLDLDYYDEAMAYAQKAADLMEQKRAGVDSDTAAITKRAKVGKEKLGAGVGSGAITAIHLLMNKRGSKFFFVNPLAFMYRIITAFYLAFMSNSSVNGDSRALIISAFAMMIMLNAVVYAGGKTVTEFTKHYIYLIPEKASSKLLACIRSDIPEMAFDSLLCGVLMVFMCGFKIPEAIAFGVLMLVYDMLCEMAALLVMKIFPMLGRYLLMLVRYLGVMIVVGLASVPLVVVLVITKSLVAACFTGALVGAVLLSILIPIASKVVERVEL
ncbi:MAG: hypothetical protein IJ757_05635 [Clostridiales bacterium]|nr:hypothetical protein [Clostridiales bacterium]